MKEEGREDYGPSRKHKEEVGVGDNTRGAGEGGGGRRKCGGHKQGLNDKKIMATVLLPSTHRNRPNFIYTRVFMTLKPPDGIISDRWCSKKKLGRTLSTHNENRLSILSTTCVNVHHWMGKPVGGFIMHRRRL